MSNNNGTGFSPTTIIERTWEGLPGYILRFPVSIALSGKMATEREQAVALGTNEKAERLLDFRMRTLADVLDNAPTMILIAGLESALQAKRDRAADEAVKAGIKLTREEVEALAEPLPGFPEEFTPETAYEYLSREDAKGRKVLQLLIEDVINEFWYWATPRPTISVSAFMQGK